MVTRHSKSSEVRNDKKQYSSFFAKRDVKYINHLTTAELEYPSEQMMEEFELTLHIWKVGDRYYKLANTHYGDPKLWWVIAFFNKKPTEQHLNLGDKLFIPKPIEKVLASFGV